MQAGKTTFALFFGNREFFPASLQRAAREDMTEVLEGMGHEVLLLDEDATGYGAVKTMEEGRVYADFLREHRGEFGGVILSLPNFGDESGAVTALRDADVPILVQAYPDAMDKMGPDSRRDSFCGKFSIMDVFHQYGLKFTALQPHTVHPRSDAFAQNVDYFDRVCRVVNGLARMSVGAIGARTTAFKTVRFDELALQRHGITVETVDLADVFARVEALDAGDARLAAKKQALKDYVSWEGVPDDAFDTLSRLGVVFDRLVDEFSLDALAIRCWLELQEQLGVSPCVLLSYMNDHGMPTACEVDVGNAVMMAALHLASGDACTCLDWNNNYKDEWDKCILFHCGSAPQSLMTDRGHVVDHGMLIDTLGEGHSWGCNVGRLKAGRFTYGSLSTEEGQIKTYVGEGQFTGEPIPDDFFGCAGVAQIDGLQDVLQTIGYGGFRHHVSLTPGRVVGPMLHALEHYLGYDVIAV